MKPVISIVAPSSVVPQAELSIGADSLRSEGFDVRVHPQCRKKWLFFAGSHEERARALLDEVYSDAPDILWCARGGYGSNHLLRMLDEETRRRGRPAKPKLLAGSSDATSLLEFARTRWGFSTLHSPMPGLRNFLLISAEERQALLSWVRGQIPSRPWGRVRRLKWFGRKPSTPITGEVVGGNLVVWNTMLGTRLHPRLRSGGPKILFLEDVTETLPRLDRAVRHLVDAGGLEGVSAIVLGNFLSCEDAVPNALASVPKKWTLDQLRQPPKRWLAPLRRSFSQAQGLREIFSAISEETGVPVAHGLPVGHGPEHFSLPIGCEARLDVDGAFSVVKWEWLRG
jgi:muramoyltetrapeptide carboxypeptidase